MLNNLTLDEILKSHSDPDVFNTGEEYVDEVHGDEEAPFSVELRCGCKWSRTAPKWYGPYCDKHNQE